MTARLALALAAAAALAAAHPGAAAAGPEPRMTDFHVVPTLEPDIPIPAIEMPTIGPPTPGLFTPLGPSDPRPMPLAIGSTLTWAWDPAPVYIGVDPRAPNVPIGDWTGVVSGDGP